MTYTPLTEELLALLEAAAMDARDGMVDVIDDDLLSMLAEIRALRADKARLDWAERHCCQIEFRTGLWPRFEVRAIIDAAMKEGRC
jgi:hypothetical protein